MMHFRDAAGRKVSLLNDDSSACERHAPHTSFQSPGRVSSQSYPSPRSNSSNSNTPELLRSDSYDSQISSSDAISPMTPSVDFAYTRPSLYHLSQEVGADGALSKRPSYAGSSHSASFDDEMSTMADRPGKRYPCRYRDSHGCDKTFTTSGHASRHSKIHTAEKAVQCTFSGCSKKFTRADNMKQHLETHYKDKSRSSGSQRAHKAALVGSRRTHSSSGRSRSPGHEATHWETEQYDLPTPPLPSAHVATTSSWDVRGMNLPLLSRSVTTRNPSSGLDALAMAVACQEGTR